MKVIIAGSRTCSDHESIIVSIKEADIDITEVVCGEASGADKLGKEWAEKNSIPVKSFPADWNKYGKSAGPIRNKEMAKYADSLIAIWDGSSRGTKNMINEMNKLNKFVFVYQI